MGGSGAAGGVDSDQGCLWQAASGGVPSFFAHLRRGTCEQTSTILFEFQCTLFDFCNFMCITSIKLMPILYFLY